MSKSFRLFKKSMFIVVLSVFFCSPSVFAYVYYYDQFWIPLHLEGGISSGHYYNGTSDTTYNGKRYDIHKAFDGAFSLWKNATDMDLSLGSNISGAKISAFQAEYLDDAFLYGWTHFYKDGSLLNERYGQGSGPSENWDKAYVFLNLYAIDDYGMDWVEYRAVAAHEIGHALGLQHNSEESIMNNSFINDVPVIFTNGWTYPQQDDIDGVNNLY